MENVVVIVICSGIPAEKIEVYLRDSPSGKL